VAWTIASLGLASLCARLARRDGRFTYLAAPLLLLMLPCVFAQPVVRYGYPVVGILVFLAADIAWRPAESLSERPLHGHVLAATPEAQSH